MGDGKTAEQLIQEAALRKAVADAEKAEAQAEKAKQEAQTSAVKSQPAEGKITADAKSGYIATLAAYNAMVERAGDIAGVLNGLLDLGDSPRILILDSLDFCAPDVQLMQISAQLGFWQTEFDSQIDTIGRILPPKDTARLEMAAIPVVAGVVSDTFDAARGIFGVLADVVGYFRVDYDIKGQTISLSNSALQALVAGRIDRRKCSVFLPAFHRIESPEAIPVIEKLNECIRLKDHLKQLIEKPRLLSLQPTARDRPAGATNESKSQTGGLEEACQKAEKAIAEFADFNKAVTSAPQGGGYSPLAGAAIRQYLDRIGITHLLYLGVTSSGGEMVLGKGLFQSGKVGFLGGCVITYVLAKCSGEIMAADTISGHSRVRYKLCGNSLSGFEPK